MDGWMDSVHWTESEYNLDKPSDSDSQSCFFLYIFPYRCVDMGHSKLKEIDKLRFGKSSWETVFWEDLKILWIKWNGKWKFILSWLTFEIPKYSLWAALTNHISPNICQRLTENIKKNTNITIKQNNFGNSVQNIFLKSNMIYESIISTLS